MMGNNNLIGRDLSRQVLMIGVYYKNNAPGGMAAVIQYYEKYYEKLNYISSWKDGGFLIKLWYGLSAYMRVFLAFLFNRNIKLVHIHTAADRSFYRKMHFVKLAKFFNKKIALHVHASRFKDFYQESQNKDLIVKGVLNADTLIVLSKSWKDWFVSIGIPQENIVELNNIVDYPKIKKHKSISDRLNFLFLGEIGKRKGVFDILKVLADHKDDFQDKVYLRVGGNKMEKEISCFIEENNLKNFVKYEGWVSGESKIDLLNWADVFILPSYNEGLPVSILEAMSYGLAVISTPVGGIPEVIFQHKNGILIEPGNLVQLEDAIAFFVNNRDCVCSYSQQSKDIVDKYYPENVMLQLKLIYVNILSENN